MILLTRKQHMIYIYIFMINPDKSWAGTPNTRRLQVLSQYHYARPYKKTLSNSNFYPLI